MYFEKLSNKERKTYMGEKNLIEMNLKTITWAEIKKMNEEKQRFILENLIRLYGDNNTEISKHTAISRLSVAILRSNVGYPRSPAQGNQPHKYKKRILKPIIESVDEIIDEPIISEPDIEKPQIENIEENDLSFSNKGEIVLPEPIKKETKPKNIMTIKFNGLGEEIKEKLYMLFAMVDKRKTYEIDLSITDL